jgi:mannose-6-phosphate isomerase-like protein (cupin superfamily)
MAITVTDAQGGAIPDVRVEVIGISERSGNTSAAGQINFTAMQAGTYRVRFSGDQVITFEREVVVRAGQVAGLDVTLTAAPPPPAPPPPAAPEPAAPAAPAVGPAGEPLAVSVVDLIEKEYVGNQPRRETLLSCSGNTRTTLVQLNQDQPERLYDTAEATYYVVAGDGTLRVEGRDIQFPTTGFVSIPRGTAHGILHRGRRPLILIATLSGTPCEETR